MINAPFIILTNSTLILEILSLIEISVSESSGKNVFWSRERTLPSEFPEPRAPPRQRPPAAPRDRKCPATWHPWCLRQGKETAQSPTPALPQPPLTWPIQRVLVLRTPPGAQPTRSAPANRETSCTALLLLFQHC